MYKIGLIYYINRSSTLSTNYSSINQKQPDDNKILYQGNGFSLNIPEDWQDKTVYTIVGPIEKGIQHNIIIMVDHNVEFGTVNEYADCQIYALEQELKGCRLLKRGEKLLTNGMQAYEAIFRWYPTDELRIYQQQFYVLEDKVGYKLTATFSKKTRQTLGPMVERMMLSFQPAHRNFP